MVCNKTGTELKLKEIECEKYNGTSQMAKRCIEECQHVWPREKM